MNTKIRTRTMGLAALALTATMGLSACGSEDELDLGVRRHHQLVEPL